MPPFQIVGPSYQSQSLVADCQKTMNWYPEQIESGSGKAAWAMYPTPGTKVFATLPEGSIRGNGLHVINPQGSSTNRMFACAGSNFYEIFSDGTFKLRGAIGNDGLPVSMASSLGAAIQILIASKGNAFWYDTNANTLNSISGGTLANVIYVDFSDGFFTALQNNSIFKVSNPLDVTTWPSAIQIQSFKDNALAAFFLDGELFAWSPTAQVAHYLSGSQNVYDPIPASRRERGIASTFGLTKLDNAIHMIGADKDGSLMAFKLGGYEQRRISTHAIEYAWQNYAKTSDVVSYSYQEFGHTFWVLYFPSATTVAGNAVGATWAYDTLSNMWHERGAWSPTQGRFNPHKSNSHAFCFGKHLVGDPTSGNIYDLSSKYTDDNGSAIRRVRRASQISQDEEWLYFDKLQVIAEPGLGPASPFIGGDGIARDPQLMYRYSGDYTKTWSNERILNFGKAGEFRKRGIEWRLGSGRSRVWEIATADSIPWRIISASVN